jgi:hypothetical protein
MFELFLKYDFIDEFSLDRLWYSNCNLAIDHIINTN